MLHTQHDSDDEDPNHEPCRVEYTAVLDNEWLLARCSASWGAGRTTPRPQSWGQREPTDAKCARDGRLMTDTGST